MGPHIEIVWSLDKKDKFDTICLMEIVHKVIDLKAFV